jgi:SAM-dependent methyltransferase
MELFIIIILLAIFGTFAYAGYKGAPWVPTRRDDLSTIIDALKLNKESVFYDIGCGDGRLVIASAEQGARATGLEISLLPYLLAQIRRLFSPARSRVQIKYKNLWNTDLSDATHVYFFLMPEMFPKLMEKLKKELKPGSIVISYVWPLPQWVPTETIKREKQPTLFLYTL